MNKIQRYFWAAILLVGSVSASAADLSSAFVQTAPRIDGLLDDKVWQAAPPIRGFENPDGKPVYRKTEARILWTPTGLAVGFKSEAPMDTVKKLAPVPHDMADSLTDCVEIMVDPAGDGENYYHFLLNASGATYDAWREQGGFAADEKWNSDMKTAVHWEKNSWTAEIFLPYRSLGISPRTKRVWKMNLARETYGNPSAPRELTSTAKGAFHVGADFSSLTVPAEVNLDFWKVDASKPVVIGRIEQGRFRITMKADFKDLSGAKQRGWLGEARIFIPGQLPAIEQKRFVSKNDGVENLVFDHLFLNKPGNYAAELVMMEQNTGRTILQKNLAVQAEYLPIRISIQDPHYRNAIFATQKLDQVRFSALLDLPANLLKGEVVGGIRDLDGKVLVKQSVPVKQKLSFAFPVAQLPEKKMEIFVTFGKESCAVPIRKLPYKKGEVWRGKDGNWYRDGKKMFLNMAWNIPAGIYPEYNAVVATRANQEGQYAINAYPFLETSGILSDMRQGKFTDKVRDFYTQRVNKMKDDPLVFGHFLCDEPDIYQMNVDNFIKVADFIRELDPYHPIVITPGTTGLFDFADGAEISGFHSYPRVHRKILMNNFEKNVQIMDKAMAFFKERGRGPTITYMQQGFDYSDAGNTDTRVPTYDEFRNQNYLSLILGGKGLMHYNRAVLNYPELYLGMANLVKEQMVVGNEAIIEPDAKEPVTDATEGLRILAKQNEKTKAYWMLVCNTTRNTKKYSFRFAPFADKKLQVLSEERTVDASKGLVTDTFTPFQVHIYTTDNRLFDFKSLPVIRKEIEDVYIKRRAENKDNLFYQEHEGDTVKVAVSSNKHAIFRAENSLWHIADGLVGSGTPANDPIDAGIVYWSDATPNQFPDWISATLPAPKKIGRVEVYPAGDALKDYEIQVRINGEYKTVGSVKDATGTVQNFTFPAVMTDSVRVFITAARGAYSRVYEVKAFEK